MVRWLRYGIPLLMAAVVLTGCGARGTFQPAPPTRYDKVPPCDNFSAEVKAELGEPWENVEASDGLAVAGRRCSFPRWQKAHASLIVEVNLYGTRNPKVMKSVRALLRGMAERDEQVSGPWDIGAYAARGCLLRARDGNVVLKMRLLRSDLSRLCDQDQMRRVVRFARDWATQNFTK